MNKANIWLNAVECLLCHTVLVSLSGHDFRACSCGTFTDGGNIYIRSGGPDLTKIRDMSIYKRKDGSLCTADQWYRENS